jgi:hypothetical protein
MPGMPHYPPNHHHEAHIMTSTITRTSPLTARDAYAELLVNRVTSLSAQDALLRAYNAGTARIGTALVTHDGYVRDVTEYNAGTALYAITIG